MDTSYWPSIEWRTEGISVVAPVRWRLLDGAMGAFWEAQSHQGASGYYLAEDPRIMIFFDDVSGSIAVSNQGGQAPDTYRPMMRAVYIPSGIPMWTRTVAPRRFAHLNLHIRQERLVRLLAPSMGRSGALAAVRRPIELSSDDAIETLARLLVDELSAPSRTALYAESLLGGIVSGMIDTTERPDGMSGRLTSAQLNKVAAFAESRAYSRFSVPEMAAVVGLSEGWFSTVFKNTTGKTPLQWKLERRIELAKQMVLQGGLPLADVAARLGFSDQAHLTKTFRQVVGETPAAWRRLRAE